MRRPPQARPCGRGRVAELVLLSGEAQGSLWSVIAPQPQRPIEDSGGLAPSGRGKCLFTHAQRLVHHAGHKNRVSQCCDTPSTVHRPSSGRSVLVLVLVLVLGLGHGYTPLICFHLLKLVAAHSNQPGDSNETTLETCSAKPQPWRRRGQVKEGRLRHGHALLDMRHGCA